MKTQTGKINIITLGCAKNTVDSEALYAQLLTNDFTLTEEIAELSKKLESAKSDFQQLRDHYVEFLEEFSGQFLACDFLPDESLENCYQHY